METNADEQSLAANADGGKAASPARVRRFPKLDVLVLGRGLLVVIAAIFIVAFVVVAVRRCAYPYELEWMEGAMVQHVERVLHGQKLYVAPTIDFVPFIYGPIYFWVSAAFAKVMGLGFAPLRLVSLLSSLGTFALIHRLVATETKDRVAGFVAAGAFAASFTRGAQFLDLARVDALSLFFSIAAIYVYRRHRALVVWRIGAALLVGLAFLTKQSAIFVAFALVAFELVVDRRRAIVFALATLVFTVGFAWMIDLAHDGWFRYYVWELPRGHALVKASIGGFWTDDLFPAYAIAGVAGGWWLLTGKRDDRGIVFYLLACSALVAGAWSGRLHDGGWPNVLIPAFAALSIFFGLGLSAALQDASRDASRDASSAMRRSIFVLAVAAAQLLVLLYDVRRVVPKREDAIAGEAFVARLRALDGDVFIPMHAWYTHLAGKRTFAHRMAMDDVMRGDPTGEGPALVIALRHAFDTRRFSAVLLDDDYFEDVIKAQYRALDPPFASTDSRFFPVTGIHVRPAKLYVLK
jgi:4-amino-4-deoxy-L-arabinose transferase-like glycosyltransferase